MKLILAIVNADDAYYVNSSLTNEGFQVTTISTTGGFLKKGNTTFLMGVDENQVDQVLEIIKKHSRKREIDVPMNVTSANYTAYTGLSSHINVGGATIFILDVEKYARF